MNICKTVGFAAAVAVLYLRRQARRLNGRHLNALRYAGATSIGGRSTMEDAYSWSFHPGHGAGIFTVADGHSGRDAADFVCSHLQKAFLRECRGGRDHGAAMEAAFEKVDSAFERKVQAGKLSPCGSTVVTGAVFKDKLVIAGVGDCRAILSSRGKAADLTSEHTPTGSPSEKERVLRAGVFLDSEGYVNGELAVTRSIGDGHLGGSTKDAVISCPEVATVPLGQDEEFLVLTTDGVWMRSQTVVDLVRRSLRTHNCPQRAANEVVEAATRGEAAKDNVAAVVVCFGPDPPPSLAPPRKRSMLFARR